MLHHSVLTCQLLMALSFVTCIHNSIDKNVQSEIIDGRVKSWIMQLVLFPFPTMPTCALSSESTEHFYDRCHRHLPYLKMLWHLDNSLSWLLEKYMCRIGNTDILGTILTVIQGHLLQSRVCACSCLCNTLHTLQSAVYKHKVLSTRVCKLLAIRTWNNEQAALVSDTHACCLTLNCVPVTPFGDRSTFLLCGVKHLGTQQEGSGWGNPMHCCIYISFSLWFRLKMHQAWCMICIHTHVHGGTSQAETTIIDCVKDIHS